MPQVCRCLFAALSTMGLIWVGGLRADPPGKKAVKALGGAGRAQTAAAWYPAMSGYYLLSMAPVQKELKLSDEQKTKLKEISEKMNKESQQDWAGWQQIPREEQQKKIAELSAKNAKRAEEARKQSEALLTPAQVEQLKGISFRMSVQTALYNPKTLEQLGFTDEQKKKLQQIRDEAMERQQQLQQEISEKTVQLLTAEQKKKLEELQSQGARAALSK